MARLGRAVPRRFTPAPVVASAVSDPGTVLDIGSGRSNHFLLQYAQTGAGSTDTATQADILGGFSIDPYFKTTADNLRVQLWARLDAPLLGTSTFSRDELREVNADGSDAAWDANTDIHTLRVKHTPTHLPAVTPAAVFAQMYDNVATADRISIRTQLVSGTARLRIRINGSTVALDATSPINPGSNDLATGVANIVGVEWDFKVVLTAGAISIYVNDMATPVVTRPAGTLAANGAANYFKTGIYNQANTGTGDAATDWGSSEIRGLAVTHAAGVFPVVDATLPAATGAMAATATDPGAFTAALPSPTGTAAATVTATGTAPAALPLAAGSFAATSTDLAAMAATLPAGSGSAAGAVTAAGAMTAAIPDPTSAEAGTVTQTGVLVAALPVPAGAYTAQTIATGQLSAALPVPAGTSAGDTTDPGDTTGSLPVVQAALAAAVTNAGVLAGTLTGVVGAAVSDTVIPAALDTTVPAPISTTAGTVTAAVVLAASLPDVVGSLVTDGTVTGGVDATLLGLSASYGAAVTAPAELATALPVVAGVFTGGVSEPGVAAGQLPTLAATFTAGVAVTAVLSGTLPALAGQFQSSTPNAGEFTASLPAVAGQATAVVSTAGVLAGALPVPTAAISGSASAPYTGPLRAGTITEVPGLSTSTVQDPPGPEAGPVLVAAGLHARI